MVKGTPQEHNWLWCAKSWTVTFVPLRRPPLLNLVIEDRVRETNKVVPMGLLEKKRTFFLRRLLLCKGLLYRESVR